MPLKTRQICCFGGSWGSLPLLSSNNRQSRFVLLIHSCLFAVLENKTITWTALIPIHLARRQNHFSQRGSFFSQIPYSSDPPKRQQINVDKNQTPPRFVTRAAMEKSFKTKEPLIPIDPFQKTKNQQAEKPYSQHFHKEGEYLSKAWRLAYGFFLGFDQLENPSRKLNFGVFLVACSRCSLPKLELVIFFFFLFCL